MSLFRANSPLPLGSQVLSAAREWVGRAEWANLMPLTFQAMDSLTIATYVNTYYDNRRDGLSGMDSLMVDLTIGNMRGKV